MSLQLHSLPRPVWYASILEAILGCSQWPRLHICRAC